MFEYLKQLLFGKPTFNVRIRGHPAKADSENHQVLYTIEIALSDDCAVGGPISTINPPKPTWEIVHEDGSVTLDIDDYSKDSYEGSAERQMNIDIYGKVSLAGKYTIRVEFPENSPVTFEDGRGSCDINVTPGLISNGRIVENSVASMEGVCYPFDKHYLIVKCFDACGNLCLPSSDEFKLELTGETKNGLHCGCDDLKKEGIQFHFYFDRPGQFIVTIKHVGSNTTDNATTTSNRNTFGSCESFTVDVKSPFDAARSIVRFSGVDGDLPCVFAEDGTSHKAIDIQVDLIPKHDLKNTERFQKEIPIMDVRVNGKVIRSSSPDVRIPTSVPSKVTGEDTMKLICTFSKSQIPVGENTVDIVHGNQPIGKTLTIEVDSVIQFENVQSANYIKLATDQLFTIKCNSSRVPIGEIIGADHYNKNNINRVLQKEELHELQDGDICEKGDSVLIRCKTDAATKRVDYLLCFLLTNIHYRSQAREFDVKRERWKNSASQAWKSADHKKATKCRLVKEKYGAMLTECNKKASQAIFDFYNYKRPHNEIDLHGQLVANKASLDEYKRERLHLTADKKAKIVEDVKRMQEEQNEAIRHLKARMDNFDHNKAIQDGGDWLEIIVGAGNNSKNNIQKVSKSVETFLAGKHLQYLECNEGSLLIIYSIFKTKTPCMGNFFCVECRHSWESGLAWEGKYQLCNKCKMECKPFKLRPRSNTPNKNHGRGMFNQKEHMENCQVCKSTGSFCGYAVRG